MSSSQKPVFKLLFQLLYYIVNFFIIIGETFQLVVTNIFTYIARLGQKIYQFLTKIISLVKIPKLSWPVFKFKKTQKSYTPLKRYRKSLIVFYIKKIFYWYRRILKKINVKIRYFLVGTFFTLCAVLIFQSYIFVKSLPNPENIGKFNFSQSSHIYDRKGRLLYEIYRDQNRTPVSLNQLPKYVIQSTIAIEDKDFYSHNGVAFFSGILRAVKETIVSKKLQGGSTITQQLVKSSLLTPERTITRKVKEIILAVWTEKLYDKNKIIEMYLNQVPYGGSSYGIEEAAKTYFGKSARDLSLDESALLAGLPQAPSLYSPFINPKQALIRRNDVLESMYEQGYISKTEKDKAQKQELVVLAPRTNIQAPHFVFYTKSKLESTFGISKVEEGGLKVTTTLDLDVQQEMEKILKEEIEKIKYLNVNNGAILVTKPSTGEIIAMVGSTDYFEQPNGAFNVTTALRQPGSSIKPILYSMALANGYTAASIIVDTPTVFKISESEIYRPVNYDGQFHGKVPFRYALANSYNIPAVKVVERMGVENFIDYAKKLGIDTWTDKSRYGLSISLGGGEVTMVDMAESFGVLANKGYKLNANYYLMIEDNYGNELKKYQPFKIKEIDGGISYIISDILSDNFARRLAFGPNSTLEIPGYKVAVKTGTTNDKKDNWTIGYTPDFLVVVWVGNNDNTPMNPYLTSGVTGAAPIWNRAMSYLLKNYSQQNKWFERPDNVVEKNCFFGRPELFITGTENSVNCGESLFTTTPTPSPKP